MTEHYESLDLLLDATDGETLLPGGDQLLLHSALLNDREGCEKAFGLGANPNASREDRVTAIHIAAEKGYNEFTAALIDSAKKTRRKLDLNSMTIFGNTPLILAIMHDNLEVMEQILKAGADPNRPHTFERTPLHMATFFGRVRATIKLIQYNANVNVIDTFDQTPLSLALIARNSVHLVKLLLRAGADANFKAKSSLPILSLAVLSCTKYKDLKNVKFFIKSGAKVGASDNIKQDTALHKAAQTGYIKCIELLINKGADIHTKNIYGQTPLDVAIKYKNIPAAKYLMKIEDDEEEAELQNLLHPK